MSSLINPECQPLKIFVVSAFGFALTFGFLG
jgi:hypothetical protein